MGLIRMACSGVACSLSFGLIVPQQLKGSLPKRMLGWLGGAFIRRVQKEIRLDQVLQMLGIPPELVLFLRTLAGTTLQL